MNLFLGSFLSSHEAKGEADAEAADPIVRLAVCKKIKGIHAHSTSATPPPPPKKKDPQTSGPLSMSRKKVFSNTIFYKYQTFVARVVPIPALSLDAPLSFLTVLIAAAEQSPGDAQAEATDAVFAAICKSTKGQGEDCTLKEELASLQGVNPNPVKFIAIQW